MSRTWDYQITLQKVDKGINNAGFDYVELIPTNTILANKVSVHSSEFWAAKQSVVKLEHVFEMHEIEYGGELALSFNDRDYSIERTFLNKDGYLELITSLWSDDHGT